MTFYLLNSGKCDAAFNMALDEALLETMPQIAQPVLRFYGWTQPAATFGYFQKFAEIARATALRPLIRRPTGGGLVPHDADWTYSLAFPAGHEWHTLTATDSYRRVHEWIQAAFAHLGVATEVAPCCKKTLPGQCFVGHEKFDLLWRGKKIAGAAQRRSKAGLLIQGSVQPRSGWEASTWQHAMTALAERFAFGPAVAAALPAVAACRAENLTRTKYSQAAHNERR
jgi:lipoate-protein ligase A